MALQDLTPELRTRLSRVERMVGWFVILATVILLAGFTFYIYDTAQKRGWFVTKLNYATALNDFTGFKIGDPVKLMGFPAGEITYFRLDSPDKPRGISVFFSIRDPYYNYIWFDSRVRVMSDLLGNRYLEVTKGQNGVHSAITNKDGKLFVLNRYAAYQKFKALTNDLRNNPANANLAEEDLLLEATNQLTGMITNSIDSYYTNAFRASFDKTPNPDLPIGEKNYFYIPAIDAPSLEDRLGSVANQVELALPHILGLTNQLQAVLSNANSAVARLDNVLAEADPIMTNVNTITGNLRDPNGSLGNWLVPTNLAAQLRDTLKSATLALNSAHTTLDDSDTNLIKLATDLDKTLEHLADLTSNLNAQVQANSNLVTDISTAIVHTDGLVQGLKKEWFLRSAFKTKPAKKDNPAEAPLPLHKR